MLDPSAAKSPKYPPLMSTCSSKCQNGFRTNCDNHSIPFRHLKSANVAKMTYSSQVAKTPSRQGWFMRLTWSMRNRQMGDLTSPLTSTLTELRRRIIRMTSKMTILIDHNPTNSQSSNRTSTLHSKWRCKKIVKIRTQWKNRPLKNRDWRTNAAVHLQEGQVPLLISLIILELLCAVELIRSHKVGFQKT